MTDRPSTTGFYFFEPQFVNDQISVRAQSWIKISGDQGPEIPETHMTIVCAHLYGSYFDTPRNNRFIKDFKHKMDHLIAGQCSCESCNGLIHCLYCATEVLIKFERLDNGSRGGFLIITKWIRVSIGLSPSRDLWNRHIGNKECPLPESHVIVPGNIRVDYEDQAVNKYDSLLTVAQARKLVQGKALSWDFTTAWADFRR